MKDINDDRTLVSSVLSGNALAEEQLYSNYLTFVRQTVHRFVKSPEDAEDLVQISFIQIFQKLHTYKGDSRLSTWIYRLVFNQGLMHLRNFRHRNGKITDSGDGVLRFLPASSLENPGKVIEKITCEKAFAHLPAGYAKVLYLHDALGLEHREVAEALGISEGTSKSQLHKARQKMRKMINPTQAVEKRQPAAVGLMM